LNPEPLARAAVLGYLVQRPPGRGGTPTRGFLVGAALLLACCCFLLLLTPPVLFVATYIFRLSCVLCGLPRPSLLAASAAMLINLAVIVLAEAVMKRLVEVSCRAAGFPDWEAGLIVFFLALPVDLVISSGLHAALMRVPFGKGIEVWFVQRLIYLSIAVVAMFIATVVYLAKTMNG
jgi:hypothetical protein